MKQLFLVVLMALTVVSCKDDDPEAETTPLVKLAGEAGAKKWKMVGAKAFATSKLGGTAEIDLFINFPCIIDNELTLRSDFTYTMEDTGEKCDNADTINDNWVLVESPLQISLGRISLMNKTMENATLEISAISSSSFEGDVNNVPANSNDVTKFHLVFETVN